MNIKGVIIRKKKLYGGQKNVRRKKYYNIIKEIIKIRLNDGFTAEEIRQQLMTGKGIGLVGIEKK